MEGSVEDSAFPEDVEAIAAATPRPRVPRVRSSRHSAYLAWRLKNPDRRYRLLAWRDGAPKGYLILSWPSPSPRNVWVADFGYTDRSAFGGLVSALCSDREVNVTLMTGNLRQTELNALSALDFIPLPEAHVPSQVRRFLITRTDGGNPDAPDEDLVRTSLDDWAFNLLDTMAT